MFIKNFQRPADRRHLTLAIVFCAGFGRPVCAQEPINAPSATQPSTGRFLFMPMLRYSHYKEDTTLPDEATDRLMATALLSYGVTKDVALVMETSYDLFEQARNPATGQESTDSGFGDTLLMAKWRIWKKDTGPIDTIRVALLGGVETPTGSDGFGSESFDPLIGATVTAIRERQGFNGAVRYKFNTGGATTWHGPGDGPADALFVDGACLYRLTPEVYDVNTKGALYGLVEMNGIYESNGDREIILAPGLMYEAKSFAVELSVQLPVWQEIDERPVMAYGMSIGIRLSF